MAVPLSVLLLSRIRLTAYVSVGVRMASVNAHDDSCRVSDDAVAAVAHDSWLAVEPRCLAQLIIDVCSAGPLAHRSGEGPPERGESFPLTHPCLQVISSSGSAYACQSDYVTPGEDVAYDLPGDAVRCVVEAGAASEPAGETRVLKRNARERDAGGWTREI